MRKKHKVTVFISVLVLSMFPLSASSDLDSLKAAVHSPDALTRRAAVRSLEQIGKPAIEVLRNAAATASDALTRRSALRALSHLLSGEERIKFLGTSLQDPDEIVRLAVVEEIAATQPRTDAIQDLLHRARQDTSYDVSQYAAQALWPFFGKVASARTRREFQDSLLRVVTRIDLPETGWKFQADPGQTGHLQHWHAPDFDDSKWADIGIGRTWQDFGHRSEGVAYYRLSLPLPARPDHNAADLVFEAVDQSAWIWINGHYAGEYDIGGLGWDKPFSVDVGDFLNWGGDNMIVVRVAKPSGNHAGIWKPARIEVLKK